MALDLVFENVDFCDTIDFNVDFDVALEGFVFPAGDVDCGFQVFVGLSASTATGPGIG